MIYCGVQLFSDSCHVVAVSDAFAVIDQRHFSLKQQDQPIPWLESLKVNPREAVHWFFDELNLYAHKQTAIRLAIRDDQVTFIINHRKLANLRQFIYEWMAQDTMFASPPDMALILASAKRLFDDNDRRRCFIDDLPF
jgi:hypothetical protein